MRQHSQSHIQWLLSLSFGSLLASTAAGANLPGYLQLKSFNSCSTSVNNKHRRQLAVFEVLALVSIISGIAQFCLRVDFFSVLPWTIC